ncbi:MAG TPA: YqgE/AlgH family protein [Bacteroidia bacterium]|jgi:putative transcriptional regulator
MLKGDVRPGKGTILIAEPFMKDQYFKRSVVLIAEHNEEGTVGFILNHEIDLKLKDVLPEIGDNNASLFLGGPVQRDNLFYVHTIGDIIPDSIPVTDGVWWGGDFEAVKEMVRRGEVKMEHIRFFIGYSGWVPGQLEEEMGNDSWIVTAAKQKHILLPFDKLWGTVLKSMGKNYAEIANYPEDPSLN